MSGEDNILADVREAAGLEPEATEAAADPLDAAPEVEAPDAQAEAAETKEEGTGQPRRPDGKFAPKAKGEPIEAAPKAAPAVEAKAPALAVEPKAAAQATATATRAPQSWKPGAREQWAKLPPEIQAEVMRREGDVARTLQESAQARKGWEGFQQAVAPFRPFFPGDPVKSAVDVMQFAVQLRTAPPPQRAAMVAGLIQNFGVDVRQLADALDGKLQQQPAQPAYRDPRVDQLLAEREQMRVAQEQHWGQEAVRWGEGKEFFDDVRYRMGQIIEEGVSKGVPKQLEEAYDEACWSHPEVRRVLQQREAEKARQTAQAATAKAKAAGSSVRSTPAGMRPARKNGSIHDDIMESYAELSSR